MTDPAPKISAFKTLGNSLGLWMAAFCLFGLLMLGINESKIQRRMQRMSYRALNAIGPTETDMVKTADNDAIPGLHPAYNLRVVYVILWSGATLGIVLVVRTIISFRDGDPSPPDEKSSSSN